MIAASTRNTIGSLLIAAVFFATAAAGGNPPLQTGCTADPASISRTPAADRPPAALLQIGNSAVDLFGAAQASDWSRADIALQSLNEAMREAGVDLPRQDLVAKLQANLAAVADGTSSRESIATMAAANAMTQIVAELSAQYKPAVPYDVSMLGYYGRQIELGIASDRPADSRRAAVDLATVWDRVEPEIVRRGYADAARRFTDVIAELVGASQSRDFASPAKAELAAVEGLERIFTAAR